MGVCNHSVEQAYSSYIIFSVRRDVLNEVLCCLREDEVGHKRLEGSWKGVKEDAIIVNAAMRPYLDARGWLNGQETILHLGPMRRGKRPATIHWLDNGQVDDYGWFFQTSKDYAMKSTVDYTYDPTDGSYWICNKT